MKSIFFVVFLLLPFTIFGKKVASPTPSIKFNYSEFDLRFGKSLDQFYRKIKSGRLDTVASKLIIKNFPKATSFKEFRHLVERLKVLTKNHLSLSNFYQRCHTDTYSSHIRLESKILQSIDKFCRGQYFILHKKKATSSFTPDDLEYFKKSLPFFLDGEHSKRFTQFLDRVGKHDKNKIIFSNLLTNTYLDSDIRPNGQHLKSITINSKLTDFIQNRGLQNNHNRSLFNVELRSIRKKIQIHIKDGELKLARQLTEQMVSFYEQNKEFTSRPFAWKSFSLLAKAYIAVDRSTDAKYILNYILSFSKSDQTDETVFLIVWSDLLYGRVEDAMVSINELSIIKHFSLYNSKVRFWTAYTALKNDKKKLAMKLFQKTSTFSPLNYYAILSYNYLNKTQEDIARVSKFPEYNKRELSSLVKVFNYRPRYVAFLKRINIWLKLKNDVFATNEISALVSQTSKDILKDHTSSLMTSPKELKKFVFNDLISLFSSKKNYLHSFKLIHKALGKKDFEIDFKSLNALFPFRYFSKIKKIDSSIDPIVILSLIRQESAFNPLARSPVGARGLMQLMPSTARTYSRKVKTRQLKNPDTNIRIGMIYFKKLLKMFDGNLILSLAAYNAGENRVKRWKKNIFISKDPLLMIESIPFKETKKYVKLIYRNIFFYKLLAKEKVLDTNLEDSFFVSYNFKR